MSSQEYSENSTFSRHPGIDDAISLLLASFAFEEISMANLISAEINRVKNLLDSADVQTITSQYVSDLDRINQGVRSVLRDIIKKKLLLQMNLESILEIPAVLTEQSDMAGTDTYAGDSKGDEISDETTVQALDELGYETSDEAYDKTADETPDEVIDEASDDIAGEIPDEMADEIADEIPDVVSDETAEKALDELVYETSDEAYDKTADETPDEVINEAADDTAGEIPDVIPDENSDVASDETAEKAIGELVYETIDEVSGKAADESLDVADDGTVGEIFDVIPDIVSADISDKALDEIPNAVSDDTAAKALDDFLYETADEAFDKTADESPVAAVDGTTSEMPDEIPEEIADKIPDEMSDDIAEKALDELVYGTADETAEEVLDAVFDDLADETAEETFDDVYDGIAGEAVYEASDDADYEAFDEIPDDAINEAVGEKADAADEISEDQTEPAKVEGIDGDVKTYILPDIVTEASLEAEFPSMVDMESAPAKASIVPTTATKPELAKFEKIALTKAAESKDNITTSPEAYSPSLYGSGFGVLSLNCDRRFNRFDILEPRINSRLCMPGNTDPDYIAFRAEKVPPADGVQSLSLYADENSLTFQSIGNTLVVSGSGTAILKFGDGKDEAGNVTFTYTFQDNSEEDNLSDRVGIVIRATNKSQNCLNFTTCGLRRLSGNIRIR